MNPGWLAFAEEAFTLATIGGGIVAFTCGALLGGWIGR